MKNTHLSSVAALLLSLSLVIGILVSDLVGTRFITAAHAQTGSCATIVSNQVDVPDGVAAAAQGILIRNVKVGGQVIPFGLIVASSVHLSHSTLFGGGGVKADGVVVSDGGGGAANTDGVVVSDGGGTANADGVVVSDGGAVSYDGVVVSDGGQCRDGVVVSDGGGAANTDGVVVSDGASVDGVVVSDGLTATGGTLAGDGVVVSDGMVTGSDLRLVGATLTARSASVHGVITSLSVHKK